MCTRTFSSFICAFAQGVNLLSNRNMDSRARAATVEILEQANPEPFELQQYLNQLVQALKFESALPASASPLAQVCWRRVCFRI